MVPLKMFRAYDSDKMRGNLFLLKDRSGSGGKVFWRPDDDECETVEEHVPDIEKWDDSLLAQSVTRYKEIPIGEGTERIGVIRVSMLAAPIFKPSVGRV